MGYHLSTHSGECALVVPEIEKDDYQFISSGDTDMDCYVKCNKLQYNQRF